MAQRRTARGLVTSDELETEITKIAESGGDHDYEGLSKLLDEIHEMGNAFPKRIAEGLRLRMKELMNVSQPNPAQKQID